MGAGLVKIRICRHEQAEAKKDQSWSSQAPTAIAGQACTLVYGAAWWYMHQVESWKCQTGLITGRSTELSCLLCQLATVTVGAEILHTSYGL